MLVAAARRGQDIGAADVLAAYARWRRFDTALLAAATDGLNRLFSNDNPLLRLGRDLGLGLVNRLPALRRGADRARRPGSPATCRCCCAAGRSEPAISPGQLRAMS